MKAAATAQSHKSKSYATGTIEALTRLHTQILQGALD